MSIFRDSYPNEFESACIIGERQFEKAVDFFNTTTEELKGKIDYRHAYVDFSKLEVTIPKQRGGNEVVKTCPAAIGVGFVTGTIDGPGAFDFKQGDAKGNPFWRLVRDVVKTPGKEQLECQSPKPILLDTGEMKMLYDWAISSVSIFCAMCDDGEPSLQFFPLPRSDEKHHASSPPSVLERSGNDEIYDQLEQALKEAENVTKGLMFASPNSGLCWWDGEATMAPRSLLANVLAKSTYQERETGTASGAGIFNDDRSMGLSSIRWKNPLIVNQNVNGVSTTLRNVSAAVMDCRSIPSAFIGMLSNGLCSTRSATVSVPGVSLQNKESNSNSTQVIHKNHSVLKGNGTIASENLAVRKDEALATKSTIGDIGQPMEKTENISVAFNAVDASVTNVEAGYEDKNFDSNPHSVEKSSSFS
ncbi:hypothetical protein Droror1_Dr00024396 [Drosera rotundifolia]